MEAATWGVTGHSRWVRRGRELSYQTGCGSRVCAGFSPNREREYGIHESRRLDATRQAKWEYK